jgi:transcriptional regulator with XRE-family HTH domain
MQDLNQQEQRHVRTALRHLRVQMGGWASVAKAVGIARETIEKIANARGMSISLTVAFRTARILGVGLDNLISGQALPGVCPHCGHAPDFDDEVTADQSAPETSGLKLVP